MKVLFKNVGQGDSILIEWSKDSNSHYGIIDCNIHEEKNPVLEEVIAKKIKYIDFIILTHLHYDHYSGFADLLEHCIKNKIQIGKFLHTFTTEYFKIFSSIYLTQRQQLVTERFLSSFFKARKEDLFLEIENISPGLGPINLFDFIHLSFLSPNGKDYLDFADKQAKFITQQSRTAPNFNSLATIIQISNSHEAVLLTSDATPKAFKRIVNKIKDVIHLVQVPHHGSAQNLFAQFWKGLTVKKDCPALFSVGDVKKDRLPNKEVVEFFEQEGFYNESTNYVYGIAEFYGMSTSMSATATATSLALSHFSIKKISTTSPFVPLPRFTGEKFYNVF